MVWQEHCSFPCKGHRCALALTCEGGPEQWEICSVSMTLAAFQMLPVMMLIAGIDDARLWYRHLYHGRISDLFYNKTPLNSLFWNWSNSVWQLGRNAMGDFSISDHWIFVIIWSLRRNVALRFGWFLYSIHCVEAFGGMEFFVLVDKEIITFEGLCVFKHRWLFRRLGCCKLEAS